MLFSGSDGSDEDQERPRGDSKNWHEFTYSNTAQSMTADTHTTLTRMIAISASAQRNLTSKQIVIAFEIAHSIAGVHINIFTATLGKQYTLTHNIDQGKNNASNYRTHIPMTEPCKGPVTNSSPCSREQHT